MAGKRMIYLAHGDFVNINNSDDDECSCTKSKKRRSLRSGREARRAERGEGLQAFGNFQKED